MNKITEFSLSTKNKPIDKCLSWLKTKVSSILGRWQCSSGQGRSGSWIKRSKVWADFWREQKLRDEWTKRKLSKGTDGTKSRESRALWEYTNFMASSHPRLEHEGVAGTGDQASVSFGHRAACQGPGRGGATRTETETEKQQIRDGDSKQGWAHRGNYRRLFVRPGEFSTNSFRPPMILWDGIFMSGPKGHVRVYK